MVAVWHIFCLSVIGSFFRIFIPVSTSLYQLFVTFIFLKCESILCIVFIFQTDHWPLHRLYENAVNSLIFKQLISFLRRIEFLKCRPNQHQLDSFCDKKTPLENSFSVTNTALGCIFILERRKYKLTFDGYFFVLFSRVHL